MKHIKIRLEPTPHGENPYNTEVWDATGERWLFDLEVSKEYYQDATDEEIETVMKQIILAVDTAPDMLAALESALMVLEELPRTRDVCTAIDATRQAIAKARGRPPKKES